MDGDLDIVRAANVGRVLQQKNDATAFARWLPRARAEYAAWLVRAHRMSTLGPPIP